MFPLNLERSRGRVVQFCIKEISKRVGDRSSREREKPVNRKLCPPSRSCELSFLVKAASAMPHGKLEVLLVSAKGLENSDFLSKVDPYCILTCRTQEQKSSVVSGNDSPEWNECFIFNVSGSVSELNIKIYDKDTFSADDYIGEANYVSWMQLAESGKKTKDTGDRCNDISLEPVFCNGSIPTTSYNIVKDGEFHGEIRVSLSFTPERYHHHDCEIPAEEMFGGWKESSMV